MPSASRIHAFSGSKPLLGLRRSAMVACAAMPLRSLARPWRAPEALSTRRGPRTRASSSSSTASRIAAGPPVSPPARRCGRSRRDQHHLVLRPHRTRCAGPAHVRQHDEVGVLRREHRGFRRARPRRAGAERHQHLAGVFRSPSVRAMSTVGASSRVHVPSSFGRLPSIGSAAGSRPCGAAVDDVPVGQRERRSKHRLGRPRGSVLDAGRRGHLQVRGEQDDAPRRAAAPPRRATPIRPEEGLPRKRTPSTGCGVRPLVTITRASPVSEPSSSCSMRAAISRGSARRPTPPSSSGFVGLDQLEPSATAAAPRWPALRALTRCRSSSRSASTGRELPASAAGQHVVRNCRNRPACSVCTQRRRAGRRQVRMASAPASGASASDHSRQRIARCPWPRQPDHIVACFDQQARQLTPW